MKREINARELRMGNLLYDKEYDIVEFICHDIEYPEHSGWFHIKRTDTQRGWSFISSEPIPLTEEWLIKLGFEKLSQQFWPTREVEQLNEFDECWGNGNLYVFKPVGFGYSTAVTGEIYDEPDLYVHSLQNLYFAITGEELKFDL